MADKIMIAGSDSASRETPHKIEVSRPTFGKVNADNTYSEPYWVSVIFHHTYNVW